MKQGLGLAPHGSLTKVTPTKLISWDSIFGLPVGLEAPVMAPDSVNLFSC